MRRSILTAAALLAAAAAAHAGGPPPLYAVVDKVVLEPNGEAPERIQIWGSFIRTDGTSYEYGKPVAGYVYLSIAPGKEAECRAEWAKWKKAVGTGKVVAVGSCNEAGTLLKATVHKSAERPGKPDEAYAPGFLERSGNLYVQGDLEREGAVKDLLKFVKDLQQTANRSETSSPRP